MTSKVVKKGKVKTRRGVRTRLPDDFTPCKHTVLCGRGKENTMSSGNVHLKTLILKYLQSYSEAKKKIAKSLIVSEVLSEIKSNCNGDAAFVKFEGGRWWGVDDAFSREKIGKCLLIFCLWTNILRFHISASIYHFLSFQDVCFVTSFTFSTALAQRQNLHEERLTRPILHLPKNLRKVANYNHRRRHRRRQYQRWVRASGATRQ